MIDSTNALIELGSRDQHYQYLHIIRQLSSQINSKVELKLLLHLT